MLSGGERGGAPGILHLSCRYAEQVCLIGGGNGVVEEYRAPHCRDTLPSISHHELRLLGTAHKNMISVRVCGGREDVPDESC